MSEKFYYQFLYHLVWVFFCLFHPIRAIGRENIPQGGAVICPNHTSNFDPILTCFAFTHHNQLHPFAKQELRKIPVVGKLLEWGGVIFVDRGNADIKAVKAALSILKKGQKLLLFPEGTRIRNGVDMHGNPSQPKTGAALFATRTGTPLVPVYVPEKKHWFRPTTVVIGKPFLPQFAGRKPTAEELDQITVELMNRIFSLKEEAV